MKKLLAIFLSLILICSSSYVVNAKSEFSGQTLTIYNVEDYISNGSDDSVDLIAKFEELYDVKVNYYTYDTNETMYNQFTLQKEGTYDLICTSDYMIQRMIKEELIEPMDDISVHVPNYDKYASTLMRTKLKQMIVPYKGEQVSLDEFAVGYMWGTLGLIYDSECTDTIKEDIKSWDVLWDPTYENLISIKNSMRDAYVPGLMHAYSKSEEFTKLKLNYLNNPTTLNQTIYQQTIQNIFDFKLDGSTDSANENYEKISTVHSELIEMKKNIFGFEVDSGKNDIVTGKIKINQAYSGDAVYSIEQAREEGINLEYSVPLDGSNIWYDAWTMPKGSNRKLAYKFLDFLSDPVNSADNMNFIGYTPYIAGDDLFTLTGAWYGACDLIVKGRVEYDSLLIDGDNLYWCFGVTSNVDYSLDNNYVITESNVFDESISYNKGDEVFYEGYLYKSIADKAHSVAPINKEGMLEKKYWEEVETPLNTYYLESCEYDEEYEYEEGEMIIYDGVLYNSTTTTIGKLPTESDDWEEVTPYDLTYFYGGTLTEGRRAIIYPYPGYENALETQYPSEHIIARCAIMNDFGSYNEDVIIMWGKVKASANMIPVYVFLGVVGLGVITLVTIHIVRKKLSIRYKKQIVNKQKLRFRKGE